MSALPRALRHLRHDCDLPALCNVYGPHIDCLRKQPPFVGYMIRELYYDRTPEFHSDGNQRRDYIYVDDLIALALRRRRTPAEGL